MRSGSLLVALFATLALLNCAAATATAGSKSQKKQASVSLCKDTFEEASRTAGTDKEGRCTALRALSTCLSGVVRITDQEKWLAQGYVDSLQFMENCPNFVSPTFQPSVPSSRAKPHHVRLSRARRTTNAAISIWDVYDEVQSLNSELSSACTNTGLSTAIATAQADISTSLSAVSSKFAAGWSLAQQQTLGEAANLDTAFRASVSVLNQQNVDRVGTLTPIVSSVAARAQTSTVSALEGVRTSTLSWIDSFQATVASNTSTIASKHTSLMESLRLSYSSSISALVQSVATMSTSTSQLNSYFAGNQSVLTAYKSKIDNYVTAFSMTPYLNRQLPIYRYAVVSTYSQNYGNWYAQNNAAVYGGVNPSNWGDNNYYAYQISPNKELQRGLFTRKGFSGWSGTIWAEEWYYYSSTNSRQVFVMFRIKNLTNAPITWTAYWYFSAFNGWGEAASASINGANTYTYTSDCAMCSTSIGFTLPASRTSTIIFLSGSSYPSNTRCVFSAFYNDCLRLPSGLEYVDDLDTATGDYSN